jgi:hypothetical protein
MSRRRGWKRGEHLVRDEESGLIEYASNVSRDHYGVLKKKSQADGPHPQDFVKALRDPYTPTVQNPPKLTYDTSAYNVSAFVYGTTVPAPVGPATHLYNPSVSQGGDPGIGEMEIGSNFEVR